MSTKNNGMTAGELRERGYFLPPEIPDCAKTFDLNCTDTGQTKVIGARSEATREPINRLLFTRTITLSPSFLWSVSKTHLETPAYPHNAAGVILDTDDS